MDESQTRKRKKVLCWAVLAGLLGLPGLAGAGDIINLNTVSPKQLEDSMLGITPQLAESLLNYRDEIGGFKNPEDVRKVPGMTEEDFRQIFPYMLNGKVVIEVEVPKGMSPY